MYYQMYLFHSGIFAVLKEKCKRIHKALQGWVLYLFNHLEVYLHHIQTTHEKFWMSPLWFWVHLIGWVSLTKLQPRNQKHSSFKFLFVWIQNIHFAIVLKNHSFVFLKMIISSLVPGQLILPHLCCAPAFPALFSPPHPVLAGMVLMGPWLHSFPNEHLSTSEFQPRSSFLRVCNTCLISVSPWHLTIVIIACNNCNYMVNCICCNCICCIFFARKEIQRAQKASVFCIAVCCTQ